MDTLKVSIKVKVSYLKQTRVKVQDVSAFHCIQQFKSNYYYYYYCLMD